MTSDYLSTMGAAIAPSLGNHLWQSTLFAIAAGLFTLFLRKNQARARYWLWFAASAKFLIPLSLLVAMGSHLPWPRGSAGMHAGLYVAMEQVSQPFTPSTMPVISPPTPSTVSQSVAHLLPALFIAAWLCGFVMVLCVWCVRWSQISRAIREARPLREGREVEALRRIEGITGMQQRIELLSSRASLEPGIFGIAQPVLVWAGAYLRTSRRCASGSHSCPRTVARTPSRQSGRSDAHGGGSHVLVSSVGLVVKSPVGGGARTRLRRRSLAIGQRSPRLCRECFEDMRILCGISARLCVRG